MDRRDDLGNRLAIIRDYRILDDGSIEEIAVNYDYYTYVYDPDGNLIRYEYNEGNDRDVEDIWEYTYRDDGKLTKEERDKYGDGSIDRIRTYIYDENGNLVKTHERYTLNGTSWNLVTYFFDENGCLVMRESDGKEDGFVDSYTTYTCDQHANPLTESYVYCETKDDETECGEPRLMTEFSYFYDMNANMISKESRDPRGDIEYRYIFAHYPDGKLWMEEHYICFTSRASSRSPGFSWPGW